jgi:hypothetical protein
MRTDDFDHQRIKPSHQRASCLIIILKRSLNQRACVRIIHVIESASTINHDPLGCALVTTSRVDVLVPSTSGLLLSTLKIL